MTSNEVDKGAKATAWDAMGKLDHVWALDSTYGLGSARALKKWADNRVSAQPHTVQFKLVLNEPDEYSIDCTFKKGESYTPIKYWDCAMKDENLPNNLRVFRVSNRHCEIPKLYIGDLLLTT